MFVSVAVSTRQACTSVTNTGRQTPHDDIGRAYALHRAAKFAEESLGPATCRFAANILLGIRSLLLLET